MAIRCGNCFQILSEKTICPTCGYDNTLEKKEANSLEQGTVLLDRYVIGRVLGVGGFGITYLAYDMVLNLKVAIKEYLPNEFSTRVPTQAKVTVFTGDKAEQFHAGQKRFIEEARKLAKFQQSEIIVHIFDCFDENNTSYIVMEYLEGKTILDVLKEKADGKYTVEETIPIIIAVLDALSIVHQEGILHRDISPDNIFLTTDGKVKLIDFGAARYATTTHSRSLSVILKQGYAPVEQYRSKGNQGPWTDVYSVAATMYKMITGVTPEDSMERTAKDELRRPSKVGVKIDKATQNALMNALNIPIEGRPQSAAEFKDQLLSKAVKRRIAKVKADDIGKWPLGVKIAGGVLIAAIVTVLVLIQTGRFNVSVAGWNDFMLSDSETRVPNIVNSDLQTAQNKIEEQTLEFVIVNKEYSSEIPKDMVLMQSISAGSVVDKGERVEVTVSGGKDPAQIAAEALAANETTIPDTQYKSEEEAQAMLEEAGLTAQIEYENSDTVEKGLVISQDQEAQKKVQKGTTIVLTISKGKKEVTQKTETQQTTQVPETQQAPQAPQTPQVPQTPQAPQTPSDTGTHGDVPADQGTTDDGWQTNYDMEW